MQLLCFPSLCSPVLSESLSLSGLCSESPLAGEGALLGSTGDEVSYRTTDLEQEGWVMFFQDDYEENLYVLLIVFIGVTKCRRTVRQWKPRNVHGVAGSKVGGLQMGNSVISKCWKVTWDWQMEKAFYKTLCCPNHSLCSLLGSGQRHLWGMDLIF